MTDRYMKVVFTIIALSLIWLGVKDTRLEPVVSAQNQGWDSRTRIWRYQRRVGTRMCVPQDCMQGLSLPVTETMGPFT